MGQDFPSEFANTFQAVPLSTAGLAALVALVFASHLHTRLTAICVRDTPRGYRPAAAAAATSDQELSGIRPTHLFHKRPCTP